MVDDLVQNSLKGRLAELTDYFNNYRFVNRGENARPSKAMSSQAAGFEISVVD
jgi:hypothetical protein